ncbi:hypothetical protein IWW50_006123, partial [Coemansia erecta]
MASISEGAAVSMHTLPHGSGVDSQHKGALAGGSGYYAGDANMMGSWASTTAVTAAPGDAYQAQVQQQQQQASNTASDTACSSPQDTPLVKIMQQQQQQQQQQQHASGMGAAESAGMAAQPTPPLSASSHGLGHSSTDAWRAYNAGSYQQGMSVPASYQQGVPIPTSFATPMSAGVVDAGSLEHSAAGDYYATHVNGHHQQQQHVVTPATVPTHHHAGIPDMHHIGYSQAPSAHQQQQSHAPHSGLPSDAVPHFEQQAAAAAQAAANMAAAAANGGPYMGEFHHGMYGGAGEITSASAGMHLPPIDAAGMSRQNSYFGMAASPQGTFDPMSVTAAAAAAAAA